MARDWQRAQSMEHWPSSIQSTQLLHPSLAPPDLGFVSSLILFLDYALKIFAVGFFFLFLFFWLTFICRSISTKNGLMLVGFICNKEKKKKVGRGFLIDWVSEIDEGDRYGVWINENFAEVVCCYDLNKGCFGNCN